MSGYKEEWRSENLKENHNSYFLLVKKDREISERSDVATLIKNVRILQKPLQRRKKDYFKQKEKRRMSTKSQMDYQPSKKVYRRINKSDNAKENHLCDCPIDWE